MCVWGALWHMGLRDGINRGVLPPYPSSKHTASLVDNLRVKRHLRLLRPTGLEGQGRGMPGVAAGAGFRPANPRSSYIQHLFFARIPHPTICSLRPPHSLTSLSRDELNMITLRLIVTSVCAGKCDQPLLSMYHRLQSSLQYDKLGTTNTISQMRKLSLRACAVTSRQMSQSGLGPVQPTRSC